MLYHPKPLGLGHIELYWGRAGMVLALGLRNWRGRGRGRGRRKESKSEREGGRRKGERKREREVEEASSSPILSETEARATLFISGLRIDVGRCYYLVPLSAGAPVIVEIFVLIISETSSYTTFWSLWTVISLTGSPSEYYM